MCFYERIFFSSEIWRLGNKKWKIHMQYRFLRFVASEQTTFFLSIFLRWWWILCFYSIHFHIIRIKKSEKAKKKRNIRKYIFLSKHIVHWRLDWKHSENLWIFYINRSRKYKTWITLNLIEAYKYIFALKRNKKKHQNYKNEGMFVSQYKRIKNKTKTTTFEYKWIK